jgi:hypothetical protein
MGCRNLTDGVLGIVVFFVFHVKSRFFRRKLCKITKDNIGHERQARHLSHKGDPLDALFCVDVTHSTLLPLLIAFSQLINPLSIPRNSVALKRNSG